MQWTFEMTKEAFIMFQVKFVRKPSEIEEPHKWLLSIIEQEAPKVKNQIKEGAKQYILLTNLSGTAHPGTGAIDAANKMLTKALGIPAVCWWRDDLNRRLDNAWDLKWSYPELMTGPDLIRFIIEHGLSDAKERRVAALRAFLTYQYSLDKKVKFKQVELQNNLLDLFVDVPIRVGKGSYRYSNVAAHRTHSQQTLFEESISSSWEEYLTINTFAYSDVSRSTVQVGSGGRYNLYSSTYADIRAPGAVQYLLRSEGRVFPRIVLEGAPGHGKSTIAQYLCQVHRMRLLDNQWDISQLPDIYKDTPLRFPIKVDLRDLASWLLKRNPFTPDDSEIPTGRWTKSLESFLAGLISYQSGGSPFDVGDLQAIAKVTSILLVLDGLDEVADIDLRREVVEEVVKGVARLEANAASLQVVVTSRPAAFANSPGLPEDSFQYFELGDLSRELIDQYAERWLTARSLHERESKEVKSILREKLDQPHLRDLARNPMQLAILLSLIHTRGTSLPDKRTALYDSYVELFFNREAEKSVIIRDHRELLINIHRYLAWLLHSEVELRNEQQSRRNGAITHDRLMFVLKEYLQNEGHDPALADILFKGMMERVVALVSRVEGTYEFEVQPLREYFAARFLYETAPYSPTGAERRGTKPDRFDALAKDFYWLNVTRFYAGCYSKGELASLTDRLKELINDAEYGVTSHPRTLGAIFLSDWVFSQYPKAVAEVLDSIFEGVGFRMILASNSRRILHSKPVVLPKSCGKQELIQRCFASLEQQPPLDYVLDIADLLAANLSPSEIADIWLNKIRGISDARRENWVTYGYRLGCLPELMTEELKEVIPEGAFNAKIVDALCQARRFDFLELTQRNFMQGLLSILRAQTQVPYLFRATGILESFAQNLYAERYAIAFRAPHSIPLSNAWEQARGPNARHVGSDIYLPPSFVDCEKYRRFAEIVEAQSNEPSSRWASELSPWDEIVEAGRAGWGDEWAFYHIANIASGIKSSSETCTDSPDPFDAKKSLCRRARYARLRAGTVAWWPKQFEAAETVLEKMQICQLWLTWASENTITQSLKYFESIINELAEDDWGRCFDSIEEGVALTVAQSGDRQFEFDLDTLPVSLSPRACISLALRTSPTIQIALYNKYLADYEGDDVRVLRFCETTSIRILALGTKDWEAPLSKISRAFSRGVISGSHADQLLSSNRGQSDLVPLNHALAVVSNADRYPAFLVTAAEAKCRSSVAKKIIAVGQVAKAERWFES
ncbi:MAG TPA: NTPase (NACHT family)-like protein [Candidatus Binatia bacterium]